MKSRRLWVQVSDDLPLSKWWSDLCRHLQWSEDLVVEKWNGADIIWPRVVDSLRSFTLFSREKVILIQSAERGLKKEKNTAVLFQEFEKGPHHLILQSEAPPPKNWSFDFWEGPAHIEKEGDEKAVFRWIDAIQAQNLKQALTELEKALQTGQHPLVFLQLIARHYRLGRLIHHALEKGLTEDEILKTLKIPSFVLQKWSRARKVSGRQWTSIFDRLHWSDWQLKSGYEEAWILRKLSFDLVEISKRSQKPRVSFSIGQTRALFPPSLLDFARI